MGFACQDCGKVLATAGGLDVHRAQWCNVRPPAPPAAPVRNKRQARRLEQQRAKEEREGQQRLQQEAERRQKETAQAERTARDDEDRRQEQLRQQKLLEEREARLREAQRRDLARQELLRQQRQEELRRQHEELVRRELGHPEEVLAPASSSAWPGTVWAEPAADAWPQVDDVERTRPRARVEPAPAGTVEEAPRPVADVRWQTIIERLRRADEELPEASAATGPTAPEELAAEEPAAGGPAAGGPAAGGLAAALDVLPEDEPVGADELAEEALPLAAVTGDAAEAVAASGRPTTEVVAGDTALPRPHEPAVEPAAATQPRPASSEASTDVALPAPGEEPARFPARPGSYTGPDGLESIGAADPSVPVVEELPADEMVSVADLQRAAVDEFAAPGPVDDDSAEEAGADGAARAPAHREAQVEPQAPDPVDLFAELRAVATEPDRGDLIVAVPAPATAADPVDLIAADLVAAASQAPGGTFVTHADQVLPVRTVRALLRPRPEWHCRAGHNGPRYCLWFVCAGCDDLSRDTAGRPCVVCGSVEKREVLWYWVGVAPGHDGLLGAWYCVAHDVRSCSDCTHRPRKRGW